LSTKLNDCVAKATGPRGPPCDVIDDNITTSGSYFCRVDHLVRQTGKNLTNLHLVEGQEASDCGGVVPSMTTCSDQRTQTEEVEGPACPIEQHDRPLVDRLLRLALKYRDTWVDQRPSDNSARTSRKSCPWPSRRPLLALIGCKRRHVTAVPVATDAAARVAFGGNGRGKNTSELATVCVRECCTPATELEWPAAVSRLAAGLLKPIRTGKHPKD
jgi:hypothetical protein